MKQMISTLTTAVVGLIVFASTLAILGIGLGGLGIARLRKAA
jgi:hypothetical protein